MVFWDKNRVMANRILGLYVLGLSAGVLFFSLSSALFSNMGYLYMVLLLLWKKGGPFGFGLSGL